MEEGFFYHIKRHGETEVLPSIQRFFESKYPQCDVCGHSAVRHLMPDFNPMVDIVVVTHIHENSDLTFKYHLQVECKNTDAQGEDALNQAIKYWQSTRYPSEREGLFTYLGVPEDFRDLNKVLDKIEQENLPIGILLVHDDGSVEIKKEAKGTMKITKYPNYPNEQYQFRMKSVQQ